MLSEKLRMRIITFNLLIKHFKIYKQNFLDNVL